NISEVEGTLTVDQRAIEVTAHDQSKTYGEDDPELTWEVSVGELISGDEITGSLTRESGENVGKYQIGQGDLSAGANYVLSFVSDSLEITPKSLTIAARDVNKVQGLEYTFDETYPSDNFTVSSLVAGDEVTSVSLSSDGAAEGAGLGDYPIEISDALGSGLDNYTIIYNDATMTVTDKIILTVSGMTIDDKIYDGEVSATVDNSGSLENIEGSDDVELDFSGAVFEFTDKNVGEDKDVSVTNLGLTGADADKYILDVPSLTGTILPRDLELDDFSAEGKVYDGTVTVEEYSFTNNRIGDDELVFSYTVAFEDENVGGNKAVDFTDIELSGGADAGNYTLVTTTGSTTADITPRDLELSSFTASNKVYDGNTEVDSTGFSDTRIEDDDLQFTYDAAFEDPNVGEDKTVYYTNIVISGGADAANYTLASTTGTATADITVRPLEITAASDSKEYDGTALTNAGYTVSDGSVVGTETLDAVTVTGSQTDVGTSDNV
ncbi:YDG domain-containing protein, partial [Chitinivibrio alkaliphilus]|uniref:YDG domain-containing protein n=1 Tax=Chitinivibrio alkaliphilus TaxID=1505232 RepID=UPI000552CBAE